MKATLCFIFVVLLAANGLLAQNQFEESMDNNGHKTFKGFISRELLESDTSIKWYKENLKGYTPNSLALAALKQYGDSIQVLAFIGTWCEDSHFVIPKFFMLTDAAGFSKNRVTLIGVDRNKLTLSHLSEALNVKHAPTLIIMNNHGKELGRVIEYGKYGMWDKEMGEVIQSGFAK
jgi:hypothetical protein